MTSLSVSIILALAVWLALLLLVFVAAIWGVMLAAKEILVVAGEIRLLYHEFRDGYQK